MNNRKVKHHNQLVHRHIHSAILNYYMLIMVCVLVHTSSALRGLVFDDYMIIGRGLHPHGRFVNPPAHERDRFDYRASPAEKLAEILFQIRPLVYGAHTHIV
jgi:hypothetical protein